MLKLPLLILPLFLTLLPAPITGALSDHFKAAPTKDSAHSIPGIDFIYLINLDNRPDKYEKVSANLASYKITPFRFSAIYGKSLSKTLFQDVALKYHSWMTNMPASQLQAKNISFLYVDSMNGTGEAYTCAHMTRSRLANCLNHLSVLYDAYNSGYETIWVMEDSIQIVQNPNTLTSLLKKLTILVPDWEVLFTDSGIENEFTYTKKKDPYHCRPDMPSISINSYSYARRTINSLFSWEGPRFGAQSYIINRSGMAKILAYFEENKIFLTYDGEFIYLPVNAVRLNNPVVTFFYPTIEESTQSSGSSTSSG